MRTRHIGRVLIAATVGLSSFVAVIASAEAGIPGPRHQAFYRYHGSTPLSQIPVGTPIRTRTVTLPESDGTKVKAEQILYRTISATGKPVVSVTTVVLPSTGVKSPKIVGYMSFYDALTPKCDPSFTLRGGNPGSDNAAISGLEASLVNALHNEGYIVTIPDFENKTMDFVSGAESGRSALDGIKATERSLKLATKTPVGLVGYSGGSIAADWASELAPKHAPHMNLIGTAMGGIPANLAHNLAYVNGSPVWSDVIPAALLGVSRSFGINLTPFLSAFGRHVVQVESTECIGQFNGQFPNLTIKKLMKPKYADVVNVPVFKKILAKLKMGSAPGHPKGPLFMLTGKSDSVGDNIMVEKDQANLAAQYCKQGVRTEFTVLQGDTHTDASLAFFGRAFPWLADRFAGKKASSNCA